MKQEDAIKLASENFNLKGQRWKNKLTNELETVIDVSASQLRKVDYAWVVVVSFAPEINGVNVKIKDCLLDDFFANYILFN